MKKLNLIIITLFCGLLGFNSINVQAMELLLLDRAKKSATQQPQATQPNGKKEEFSPEKLLSIKEDLKRRYNFTELSPTIKREVDQALKDCNITKPIIVLQDDRDSSSAMLYSAGSAGIMTVLIVGTGNDRETQPLELIRSDIYHECGHIVNNDLDPEALYEKTRWRRLKLATGIGGAMLFNKATESFLPRIPRYIGASVAAILYFFAAGEVMALSTCYNLRKKEKKADLFRDRMLIEKKKQITPSVYAFLHFADRHQNNPSLFSDSLFNTHPGHKERAENTLIELKRAGVDFNALPIKQEDLTDATVTPKFLQQKFTEQVAKHFPHYMQK